ncbi:MAG: signal peptidase II [Vicinamibacterales bacterium]
MTTREKRWKLGAFAATVLMVLAIAQVGSYLVHTRLALHDTYVVSSFLHFTHIRNTGAVFGLFPGNTTLFAVTSTLTILAVCVYLLKNLQLHLYQYVCFGFIVGAAASNTCDRLLYGAVIDFIDVQGVPYWHYIFNIADTAIHIGAWPLVIGTMLWPSSERGAAPTETARAE